MMSFVYKCGELLKNQKCLGDTLMSSWTFLKKPSCTLFVKNPSYHYTWQPIPEMYWRCTDVVAPWRNIPSRIFQPGLHVARSYKIHIFSLYWKFFMHNHPIGGRGITRNRLLSLWPLILQINEEISPTNSNRVAQQTHGHSPRRTGEERHVVALIKCLSWLLFKRTSVTSILFWSATSTMAHRPKIYNCLMRGLPCYL